MISRVFRDCTRLGSRLLALMGDRHNALKGSGSVLNRIGIELFLIKVDELFSRSICRLLFLWFL